MKEECKNCNEQQACIPFFAHENVLMHYNHANRRMLIALVTVCITFVLTIIVFVTGYTAREKNWLEAIDRMNHPEVTDGVQQQ